MASREVEIVVVVLARLKTRDQGRFDQLDLLFERRPIRRRLSMSRQSLISGDLHRHASHQEVGLAVVERVSNHAGFVAGIFGADVAEDSLMPRFPSSSLRSWATTFRVVGRGTGRLFLQARRGLRSAGFCLPRNRWHRRQEPSASGAPK